MPTPETFWAGFHRKLLGLLTRRVRDPALARDLLQEVFTKIHFNLPT